MNNYHPNILDLPDEIFLIIFKKMSTLDIFHSFENVNRRFNRLIVDSLFTRHLEITTLRNIKSEYDQIASIDPFGYLCENRPSNSSPSTSTYCSTRFNRTNSSCCQLSSTLLIITDQFSRRCSLSIFKRYSISDLVREK